MSLKMKNLTINARYIPVDCIKKVIELLECAEDCSDTHIEAAAVIWYLERMLRKDNLFVGEWLVKP